MFATSNYESENPLVVRYRLSEFTAARRRRTFARDLFALDEGSQRDLECQCVGQLGKRRQLEHNNGPWRERWRYNQ